MSGILILNETEEKIQVDYKKLQKMAFLWNTLEKGWGVKKLQNGQYELIKENNSKRIKMDKFTETHLKTKEILK